jgi:hypothetical protein
VATRVLNLGAMRTDIAVSRGSCSRRSLRLRLTPGRHDARAERPNFNAEAGPLPSTVSPLFVADDFVDRSNHWIREDFHAPLGSASRRGVRRVNAWPRMESPSLTYAWSPCGRRRFFCGGQHMP